MSLQTFLASVLLCISLSSITHPQQKVGHPTDTGLVLEMAFVKSTPPTYQTVYWPDSPNPGNWSARFGKVAGWQLPPGVLPVRAVRVLPVLMGRAVIVHVSVLRGNHIDTEDAVGTYTLRENEKVRVEAAKDFGVEPFEIKVIRVSSLPSNLPAVENKLPSLEVVGIEQVVSALPFVKLTVRNLSERSIEALSLQVMQGDRSLVSGVPQGTEGKPLMLPGQTYESRTPLGTRAEGVAGNYLPFVMEEQRVVITGLLFSDGTTEGTPPRDFLLGLKYGRKIELRRILPLFESALAQSDSDLVDGPAKLRLQVEALSYKLTADEQTELNKTLTVKQKSIEGASHLIRKDLVDFLKRFPAVMDGKAFRTWLVRAKEHYSNWLARLESSPVAQN
ncbi:MAG: hypothetical protein ACR2HX_23410 [Pyrinomonadaceae bacterium]